MGKYHGFIADIRHAARLAHSFDQSQQRLYKRMLDAWQGMRALSPLEEAVSFSTLLLVLDDAGDPDAWLSTLRMWRTGAPDEDYDAILAARDHYRLYEHCKPQVLCNWLILRYRGLWEKAPYLPDDVLNQTIKVSVERGQWESSYLLYLASMDGRVETAAIDVPERAEQSAPLWPHRQTSCYPGDFVAYGNPELALNSETVTEFEPHHTALALSIRAANEHEIHAAFRKALKALPRQISKPLGAPREGIAMDYDRDVDIYTKWQSACREGRSKYAFLGKYAGEEGISPDAATKRLKRASRWLDPKQDVPAAAEDYLAAVASLILSNAPRL